MSETAVTYNREITVRTPVYTCLKRLIDVCGATVILLVSLPLMILVSVAIRLDSSGSVIFSQIRVGKNGHTFKCLKFRTMFEDNSEILKRYLAQNPEIAHEWRRFAKIRGWDPRVTAVGRFLRRTSLDELPQIFNVLKGEMSLVGPRPYLPEEMEQAGARAKTILHVPPGMTGLWQVAGRSEIDYEGRLDLDLWYVSNWSLWLDFKLLLWTIPVVLFRRGAY